MPKIKTVNRLDVVRLNTDRGLTLSERQALGGFSKRTTCNLQTVPFHPQWKFAIEAQQPEHAWFEQFRRITGSDMMVELAYVEIARDFLVRTRIEAERMHAYFLGNVRRRYFRKRANDFEGTSYIGNRHSRTGTLAVYSDRGFKPAGRAGLPCLHVEMRLGTLPLLLAHGLVTVQDLIDFDYNAFWDNKLHCVKLPSKTTLGRLLGSPGESSVENQAYRKRVNKLFEEPNFQFRRGFVLHNAALRYPGIRRLPSITLNDWEESARASALMPYKVGRKK